MAFSLVGIPCFNECLTFGVGGSDDAVTYRSGCTELEIRKTVAELLQLVVNLLLTDAFFGQLLEVF